MQYTYTDHCTGEQLNELVALLAQLGSPDWEYSTKDVYYFDTIYFKTELPPNRPSFTEKHFNCTEKIEIVVFSVDQNLSYLPKDINQVFFNSVSLYINDIIVADNWDVQDNQSPLKQLAYQLLQKFVDSRKEKVTESLQRILKTT